MTRLLAPYMDTTAVDRVNTNSDGRGSDEASPPEFLTRDKYVIRQIFLASGLVICLLAASMSAILLISDDSEVSNSKETMIDPLLQDEGHDHRNASQHVLYTDNIQPVSFNSLTAPGNAEVQVAESPDGNTYAYIAGWSEMHIVM
jgi:hypothetical protein